jgi:CubicO group peptidase (beta-lactamase class C family)
MYSILSYLPTALVPGHPSFERYVKEHIFDPLGLNPTTYSFAAANGTGRMADGFVRSALIYSDPLAPGTPLAAPYFLPNAEEDGDYMRVGCSVSGADDALPIAFSGPGGCSAPRPTW